MPDITLLEAGGDMHTTGGLNWGTNIQNHTTPIDAYIPIHKDTTDNHPNLFDIKQGATPVVNLHWDDGVIMTAKIEGNSEGQYPKNIASTPEKNTMGAYLRGRFGVAINEIFTMEHIEAYGRSTVTIERIDATNYRMDLSV